jgi:hypothetical protein
MTPYNYHMERMLMDKIATPEKAPEAPTVDLDSWGDDCGLADLAKDAFARVEQSQPAAVPDSTSKPKDG